MHFGKRYIADPEYGGATVAAWTQASLAVPGARSLDGS